MAKYNKIKVAIINKNNRLMAIYKISKVAISQYKYIVMATYKQAFTPNEMERKRSQVFYPINSQIYDYSLILNKLKQINNVHKNI